jgi:hypothetical protein
VHGADRGGDAGRLVLGRDDGGHAHRGVAHVSAG